MNYLELDPLSWEDIQKHRDGTRCLVEIQGSHGKYVRMGELTTYNIPHIRIGTPEDFIEYYKEDVEKIWLIGEIVCILQNEKNL